MAKLKQDDVADDMLEKALEDSFPASDPPAMTAPKSTAGSPKGKKTSVDEAFKRKDEEDTGSKERSDSKGD